MGNLIFAVICGKQSAFEMLFLHMLICSILGGIAPEKLYIEPS